MIVTLREIDLFRYVLNNSKKKNQHQQLEKLLVSIFNTLSLFHISLPFLKFSPRVTILLLDHLITNYGNTLLRIYFPHRNTKLPKNIHQTSLLTISYDSGLKMQAGIRS